MDKRTIYNFSNRELVREYEHAKKRNLLGKKSKLEKEIKNRGINASSKYAHLCTNPTDFIGNRFQDSSNLIIIKTPNTFVCFTRKEVESIKKENHYYYIDENMNTDLGSFYVIPYVNLYVDETLKNLLDQKVNTIRLVSREPINFKHKGRMTVYKAEKMDRCALYDNMSDCKEKNEYNDSEVEDEVIDENYEPSEETKKFIEDTSRERKEIINLRPPENMNESQDSQPQLESQLESQDSYLIASDWIPPDWMDEDDVLEYLDTELYNRRHPYSPY